MNTIGDCTLHQLSKLMLLWILTYHPEDLFKEVRKKFESVEKSKEFDNGWNTASSLVKCKRDGKKLYFSSLAQLANMTDHRFQHHTVEGDWFPYICGFLGYCMVYNEPNLKDKEL